MLIEVECDDILFDPSDKESCDWFAQEVIMNTDPAGQLILHSNEIGDTVGTVRVLVVHNWPPNVEVSRGAEAPDRSAAVDT